MRSRPAILALALTSALAAQDPAPLEARLAALERKAARADVLAERVEELEGRLEAFETAENDARLESAINALAAQDPSAVTVAARRAKMITIGGQVRLRTEYRSVWSYQQPPPANQLPDEKDRDEDVTIQRTRVNFDARILDDVRAFVEIQDSRMWGEEQNVLGDLEGVDLHQGFVDFERIFGSTFTFRTGRFELSLWNQRLISPLDWHPVSRAWDGVLVFGKTGDFDLWGGYHAISEDPFIDSDKDTDLYWLSATYTGVADNEFGGAFFWLHSNTGAADFSFGTATLHAQGKFGGGFDYSADGVIQFGDNETRDVWAYAWAATFGYTFDAGWKPRLGAEWTFATGDEDPTDDDFNTFNPLFPFGHYYQGYLDINAWQNEHDVAIHFEVKPAEAWWAEVAFHGFWLDETEDAWFNSAGAPIRFVPTADNEDVGFELDLSGKYWFSKDVWLWFGYSHFFAGDYVDETGDSPDTDWIWLQLTAGF